MKKHLHPSEHQIALPYDAPVWGIAYLCLHDTDAGRAKFGIVHTASRLPARMAEHARDSYTMAVSINVHDARRWETSLINIIRREHPDNIDHGREYINVVDPLNPPLARLLIRSFRAVARTPREHAEVSEANTQIVLALETAANNEWIARLLAQDPHTEAN